MSLLGQKQRELVFEIGPLALIPLFSIVASRSGGSHARSG